MNMLENRILQNPLWAIEKVRLALKSKLAMNKNDIMLAMFPKTGSTWIRYFLFNLLNESESKDFQSSIDLMNATMPEFGHESMFSPWLFDSVPRLVKTHRPSNWLTRGYRTVLVVRDPRDVVISYFHYANAKKELNFSGELSDVINHPEMGFEYFFKQFNSWCNEADLILKYEDLKRDPKTYFRQLCDFIGVVTSDDEIERAIEKSDLKAMRDAQASSKAFKEKFDKDFVFARKGVSGEWKILFGAKELAIWDAISQANNFSLYT